jgi:hypothetical protein
VLIRSCEKALREMLVPAAGVVASQLLFLAPAFAAEGTAKAAPRPLAGSAIRSLPSWDGPQLLSATEKGEVFLLSSGDLAARSVVDAGKKLSLGWERDASGEVAPPFLRAGAVGADGRNWVLLDLGELRLFEKGAERPLPAPDWMIHWVTMVDGDPVAVTLPLKFRMQVGERIDRHPLLLRWTGEEWREIAPDDELSDAERGDRTVARQRRAAMASRGANGSVWVANAYSYRIRRFSSGGRLLLDAGLQKGRESTMVAPAEELARENALLAEVEKKSVGAGATRLDLRANVATQAICDLGEGPDGRLYLLVRADSSASGRLAIDRFDASQGLLERVPLTVSWEGWSRMAVGRDGIYVAPFNAKSGERRKFSWEQLDEASWSVVPGFEVSSRAREQE